LKKNIAVIGCGYWGKNLVRNFAELGALNSICDADAQCLLPFKKSYPKIYITTEYNEILNNPDIQGIVVSTPAATHYEVTKQALRRNKDVMVEKPLALTLREGEELVNLATSKKRILLVGHLLLYHPVINKLKELLDSGELGKINYIYSNRLNLGKFRTEENILWSFAPHDISIILSLLNELPEYISAHGGYYLHKDVADVTLTTMSFKDGINAHIFVSWLHPYKEQKLIIIGDKKMAVFDDTNPEDKLNLYSHEIEWVDRKPVPHQKQAQSVKVAHAEPLRLECQDFIHCIDTRQTPKVDGPKGLKVLEILSACQKSLEQNGAIIRLTRNNEPVFIHETSVVEEPVSIGEGTKIWHFSHIMPDVIVGKNCVIGQNVFIARNVIIGNNCKLENNVSVFEGVILEDNVFCGPSCVFTNVINPRSEINRKSEFKRTMVKIGASIGANATIVCGHDIGRYAFIGAGAIVTKDVPDYAMVYGNPAVQYGWICQCGERLEEFTDNKTTCSKCSRRYQLKDKGKTLIQLNS
jgi:UDP-2-acetamido-3-amino-2,3-dideoxy-glucuronate N-acetyltransferase